MSAATSVFVADRRWNTLGVLQGWDGLEMRHRYCDVGSGLLDSATTDENRELTQPGNNIVVVTDGVVEMAGPMEFGETTANNDITLKVDFKDQLELIRRRIAYADPTRPFEQQDIRYSDDRVGIASSVVLAYINANCGPGALPYRNQGIALGEDPGVGPRVSVQARMDPLLDLVRQVAIPNALGVVVGTVDRQHTVTIYQTRDLSQELVFSPALMNVASSSWTLKAPASTRVLAGGTGDGELRFFAEVSSFDSLAQEAVWGRIESFYDYRSAADETLLDASLGVLAEKGEQLSAEFTPTEAGLIRYGIDYRLGDFVTVILRPAFGKRPPLTAVKPIREVVTKVSASGARTQTPIAGDYTANSRTGKDLTMKDLLRRVALLETRK